MTIHAGPGRCQETSLLARDAYLPCNAPAANVMWSVGDARFYRMCDPCADHNLKRGMIRTALTIEMLNWPKDEVGIYFPIKMPASSARLITENPPSVPPVPSGPQKPSYAELVGALNRAIEVIVGQGEPRTHQVLIDKFAAAIAVRDRAEGGAS